jgi:prenyltransferase beta subunit
LIFLAIIIYYQKFWCFEGGPGQLPHLATTYASVMALVSVGKNEALSSIDRSKIRRFIEVLACFH